MTDYIYAVNNIRNNTNVNTNNTDSNYQYELDNSYKYYINDEEKQFLEQINEKASNLSQKQIELNNITTHSVKKVYQDWVKILLETFTKVTNILSRYSYYEGKTNSENWWETWSLIFHDIWEVLTDKDRLIYVGLTFIVISIFLNFLFSLG